MEWRVKAILKEFLTGKKEIGEMAQLPNISAVSGENVTKSIKGVSNQVKIESTNIGCRHDRVSDEILRGGNYGSQFRLWKSETIFSALSGAVHCNRLYLIFRCFCLARRRVWGRAQ
jgi:hypothetical protein